MSNANILKYGYEWPPNTLDVDIEFAMLRNKMCGEEGELPHFKAIERLLWPEDDVHRWSDLAFKHLVQETITVLMGPADAGKTYPAAKWALIEYWTDHDNTLVIVSSTDVRGLELRVWGAIKDLFNRATDIYPHLAGTPLESYHSITTDKIQQDDKARVLRKGIICIPCMQSNRYVGLGKYVGVKQKRLRQVADECFPAGTLVDCPNGPRPIETLEIGDEVISAIGRSKILATFNRPASELYKIRTKDGREVICTGNHPFITNEGWIQACNLTPTHYLLSPYEAMQAMREADAQSFVLQQTLRRALRNHESSQKKEVLHEGQGREDRSLEGHHVRTASGTENTIQQEDDFRQSDAQSRDSKEGQRKPQSHWLETTCKGRQRVWTNKTRTALLECLSTVEKQLPRQDREEARQRIPSALQSGCCVPLREVGGGVRWSESLQPEETRPEEGSPPRGSWVDSVEILKQRDFDQYQTGYGECQVYTLQVEGHSSYSVNGLLAKNCQLMGSSFLDAIPNFLGKDYKGVFLGNPLDPIDPLGRVAEPVEGWDKQQEPNETTCWRTRFHNGICVNFVGTDSPNYDYPNYRPARYPYMINWRKVEAVKSFWQEDSIQYYSQCKGVMRYGLVGRRVITQTLCRQHNAHDEAVWTGRDIVSIYAIDPAYGGDDRCVGGRIQYGPDRDGKLILKVYPPRVIPVKPGIAIKPEDQIAQEVKKDLEKFSIPVQNCYYDSFGKGTVGHAFALIFGHNTPKPVDSGAPPSTRPVRNDLFIYDKGLKRKRLKRCDEHYSKFISELWFSVRYSIECGQLKELPQDVMMEGCLREYGMAMGNKVEVEKKADTRKRMGRSPDLFDWLAIAVEGARDTGFVIGNPAETITEEDPFDDYRKQGDDYNSILKKAMLVHH